MTDERIKFLAYMLYIHQTDAENVYMEEFEELERFPDELNLMRKYYDEFEAEFGVRHLED